MCFGVPGQKILSSIMLKQEGRGDASSAVAQFACISTFRGTRENYWVCLPF